MSLDLDRVAQAVSRMVSQLQTGQQERARRLESALGVMKSADPQRLQQKAARSRTSFLVAGLVDGLAKHLPPQSCPADYTVFAADGSHIDVDRHQPVRCYLINTGTVVLGYGDKPEASLQNQPSLCAGPGEMVISDGRHEQPVEGVLLGIKRGVEEAHALADVMKADDRNLPSLALLDGSLILWGLVGTTYPEFVSRYLLEDGFLKILDDLQALSRQRPISLASYISFPRSTDVVNTLRLVLCPHEPADCDRYCAEVACGQRPCDNVAGVIDAELFGHILQPGERSPLFISNSSIQKRYGQHQVYFFYMRVDDELARVEIPAWIAGDNARLEMTHTLLLDQCQRGQGYPVALSEAHEQAVLTGADRALFQSLVEEYLANSHLSASTSAKNRSKRTKWI